MHYRAFENNGGSHVELESRLRRKPNFLMIGAAKSGTTSLFYQLSQHPQIFMHPRKKLNFFAIEEEPSAFHGPPPLDQQLYATCSWSDYCEAFSSVTDQIAIGEASNTYLYSPSAAERIKRYVPDAKLIAVLRHPAERAYSRFLQMVSMGREPISDFFDALQAEKSRIHDRWWPEFHYVQVGMYYTQLARYFAVFPSDHIKLFLHEDMQKDPGKVLSDIYSYLGVRPDFVPEHNVRYSISGLPRNRTLDWTLRKLRVARPWAEKLLPQSQLSRVSRIATRIHGRNVVKPPLRPEVRQWLISQYRDDTLRLQDLIRRDLSGWLK